MSQEQVERLRMAYERFGAEGLAFDWMTEDIEVKQPDEVGGGAGVYQGHEGVARGLQELLDTFDDMHAVPEKFIPAGDYIVVFVRLRGRAKASGVETELRLAVVYTVRDGKIVRGREYIDRQQALEAVGLRE
jgi:ketosteroid isomerase-like protein